MLDINLPNFVTVAVIAVLSALAVKTAAKALGKTSPI
jgi:hypothetical protein